VSLEFARFEADFTGSLIKDKNLCLNFMFVAVLCHIMSSKSVVHFYIMWFQILCVSIA